MAEEYLQVFPERGGTITDVVVIRPPTDIDPAETNRLAGELSALHFLPILLPQTAVDSLKQRWFPTDAFREVGPWIFRNYDFFNDALSKVEMVPELQEGADRAKKRVINFPLDGGNFVYDGSKKVFVYSSNRLEEAAGNLSAEVSPFMTGVFEVQQQTKNAFQTLRENNWRLFPISTKQMSLKNGIQPDLDFLLSLFEGKDGDIHAIAAECFKNRVPKEFKTHVISNKEAIRGGCNIADLRGGKVLVAPNPADAPTSVDILANFASAQVVNAPKRFLDEPGDGGVRCSISSFSIA